MKVIALFFVSLSFLLTACSHSDPARKNDRVRRILKMQDEIGQKNLRITKLRELNKKLHAKLKKNQLTKNQSVKSKPTASEIGGEHKLYSLFVRSYRDGKLQEAERALRLLRKAYPGSSKIAEAHYLIAKQELQNSNYKKSIFHYDKIVKGYPKSKLWSAANYEKAQLYKAMNLKSSASKVLQDLIRRRPNAKESKMAKRQLQNLKK